MIKMEKSAFGKSTLHLQYSLLQETPVKRVYHYHTQLVMC